jgi:hypothetical protein
MVFGAMADGHYHGFLFFDRTDFDECDFLLFNGSGKCGSLVGAIFINRFDHLLVYYI